MSKESRRKVWHKVLARFDQKLSGEVRRVTKSDYDPVTGSYTQTYLGQVCNIVNIESIGSGTKKNTFKKSKVFIIAFNETLKTYNSAWVLQSSATAAPFEPSTDDSIFFAGIAHKIIEVVNMDADDQGVFQITAI